jgi:Ca-activated chloride channel family protein
VIVWDSYPDPLPDLFSGSQLVLVGRYKGQGSETIKLSGIVNGEAQTFEYKDQVFRAEGGPEFLPRLWATRKIGSLLNQIRLQGPEEELVDQIVRLSIRYGIITPYTSFLVTEPNALGSEAQESIAADAYQEMLAAPTVVAGKGAVDRAAEEWEMGAAEVPLAPPTESADVVKIAGQYTFRLVEGVWIDTRFDSDTMTIRKVPFLSEDYFALADSLPDLATAFALGDRVIAVSNGIAYEIVSSEESGDPIVIPTTEQQTNPSPQSRDPEVPIDEENGSTGGFIPSCSSIAIVLGLLLAPLGSNRREQF